MYGNRRGNGFGRRAAGYGRQAAGFAAPLGYRYVGACRCGAGPNAYYEDSLGRVVSAAEAFGRTAQMGHENDLAAVRAEKEELERRLKVLDSRLNDQG